MRRRFVAKRSGLNSILKIMIGLIIVYVLWLSIKFVFKLFTNRNHEIKVNEYLAISSNNLIGEIKFFDLMNFNLNSPDAFLKLAFSEFKPLTTSLPSEIVPVTEETKEPLIYIYNTHQTENYHPGSLREYNITPTVYMASVMLQKALAKHHLSAIVEEANIKKLLTAKGWNYNRSYEITRELLGKTYQSSPSLEYFIDLHRDSTSGTVTIDGHKYAQMMFVVGMNHNKYQQNEALVLKFYDYLNENYPGSIKKTFYSKNNRYNQDFHQHAVLIEVGGPDNNIEEVYNSINILAEAMAKVVNSI